MVTGPLVGLPAFEPISRVVPFTYRDTATNMELVNSMRGKLNEFVDAYNVKTDEDNAAFETLRTGMNAIVDVANIAVQESSDAAAAAQAAANLVGAPASSAITTWLNNDGQPQVDTSVAARIGESTSQTRAALATFGDARFTLPSDIPASAKRFGAKGDGTTDDTTALENWLNAPGTEKVLTDGVYRITRGLNITRAGTRFVCKGATLLGDTASMTMLTVTGADSVVEVKLDGNRKAGVGVLVNAGNVTVQNSLIERIGNPSVSTVTAVGISVTTHLGVYIRGNIIRNVDGGPGDGIAGNGFGMGRGIAITSSAKDVPAVVPSIVENNYIEGIDGEEGDSITVLFEKTTMGTSDYFLAGFVTVRNNVFRNASKRFIKVQATDVTVHNNKLLYDRTTPPPGWNGHIQAYRATRFRCTSNETSPVGTTLPHINIQQGTATVMYGVVVENNYIRVGAGFTDYAMFISDVNNASIRGNVCDGAGFATNRADYCVVQGNTIIGGPDTTSALVAIGSYGIVRDNTDLSVTRTAVRWKDSGGTGKVFSNNLPATP